MFQEVLGKEVFTESVGAAVAEGYSLTSLSRQIVFSKKSFSKYHKFKDALCSFVYKSKSEVFRRRYIVLSGIFINTEAALTNNNDNRSKERGM